MDGKMISNKKEIVQTAKREIHIIEKEKIKVNISSLRKSVCANWAVDPAYGPQSSLSVILLLCLLTYSLRA
jgi:hypothetical protein